MSVWDCGDAYSPVSLTIWISPLAGDNGVSQNGSPNVKFTDLSATLNLIPRARIRFGRFKQPGSEEALRPAVLHHYIRSTNLSQTTGP